MPTLSQGNWYGDSNFDFVIPWTKRRFTAVSTTSTYVQLSLITPMPTLPVSTTGSPSYVQITQSGKSWLNGFWRVTYNSGTTLRLDKKTTGVSYTQNAGFTPGWGAAVWKVNSLGCDVTDQYSDCSPDETKRLSLIPFNLTLGSASSPYTMSNYQYQVYTFLKSFYSMADVKREYDTKYNLSQASWGTTTSYGCGYGPVGGYALDKILKGFMATVYAESNWYPSCKNDDNYRGLWQIAPDKTGMTWWPTGDLNKLYDVEYNTRAAIYLMFDRLFTNEPSLECTDKPYRDWNGSQRNNTKYQAAQLNMSSCLVNSFKAQSC